LATVAVRITLNAPSFAILGALVIEPSKFTTKAIAISRKMHAGSTRTCNGMISRLHRTADIFSEYLEVLKTTRRYIKTGLGNTGM